MAVTYVLRPGGILRCCAVTLDEAMQAATVPPKEGDKLACKYGGLSHAEDGKMRFHDGAWEWDSPEFNG